MKQWFKLGIHLGLKEDQLKKSELSENPTGAVLIAAKVNNIDLNWKQVTEGLLAIWEYTLAESLCNDHGRLIISQSLLCFQQSPYHRPPLFAPV